MSKRNIALLASIVFCFALLIGYSKANADANAYSNADLPAGPCQERPVVHVATDGTDHQDCGSAGDPCRSLRQGLSLTEEGDAVCAGPGTYTENWLSVPTGVWMVGTEGAAQTAIYSQSYSAGRFTGVQDAGVSGFEVYGDWSQGAAGDGLIRVYNASGITLRDLVVHDAPYDQDCIKVSGQVRDLLIERVVAWNPGPRTTAGYWQENIDIYGGGSPSPAPPP